MAAFHVGRTLGISEYIMVMTAERILSFCCVIRGLQYISSNYKFPRYPFSLSLQCRSLEPLGLSSAFRYDYFDISR
jgi:hypothetical protein